MLAHRLLQQPVEFFLCCLQCVIGRPREGQFPISIRRYLSVAPLQPVSWRKFFDSFHESPWTRHIVQREITIETRKTQSAIDLRVQDRKSTRLNSSHGYISYAVFCLKKKKNDRRPQSPTRHQPFNAAHPHIRSWPS